MYTQSTQKIHKTANIAHYKITFYFKYIEQVFTPLSLQNQAFIK